MTSPQREAQLRSIADSAAHADGHSSHITGSFAVGASRITGNTEFHFARRDAQPGERPTITGEGSSSFGRITGDSWRDQSRVTGTEGHFARNRNPSERSGKPQVFANARVFKAEEKHEAHPNNVTGILTVRADGKARGARVTVSGGAVT